MRYAGQHGARCPALGDGTRRGLWTEPPGRAGAVRRAHRAPSGRRANRRSEPCRRRPRLPATHGKAERSAAPVRWAAMERDLAAAGGDGPAERGTAHGGSLSGGATAATAGAAPTADAAGRASESQEHTLLESMFSKARRTTCVPHAARATVGALVPWLTLGDPGCARSCWSTRTTCSRWARAPSASLSPHP